MIAMQDPIYEKLTKEPRPTLFATGVLLLLATLGLWLSSLLELALPQSASPLVINASYYLPFIALPLALYARRRPGIGGALRLNPPPLLPTLALAPLAILSVYVASTLAFFWELLLNALGFHSPGGFAQPQTEAELALAIVSMAAMPAVCEELLFRGFALSAWESRGTRFAIGVTALLFALLHGNLYGLPAYLLVGAVAGFVTFALDSVYAGIVYHTVYNAACLVIPFLLSGGDGDGEIALSLWMAVRIVLEFAMRLGMMGLLLAALWLRARRAGIDPIPRIRRPLEDGERVMLILSAGAMLLSLLIVTLLAFARQGGSL